MKREIKFRGKRIDNKEWVYGSLVNNLWLMSSDKSKICEIIAPSDNCNYSCWEDLNDDGEGIFRVDCETVGQYTGLKDKNGVEIYEGDIVKMDSFNPCNYHVMFIDGAFCLWNDKVNYATDIHYTHHAERNQSSVIGNIYENPELLK